MTGGDKKTTNNCEIGGRENHPPTHTKQTRHSPVKLDSVNPRAF